MVREIDGESEKSLGDFSICLHPGTITLVKRVLFREFAPAQASIILCADKNRVPTNSDCGRK
jgi:hypothetical protein